MCAFEVKTTPETIAVPYQSFFTHGVLHLKNKQGRNYVIEKDNSLQSLWSYLF